MTILRFISFALVQAIYPLIPDLYGVFQDLAANRYFSQDAIRSLSGNIYIVISACMLFALGIKLLSAIVNPEVLTDKKKGVRSVALHIIFAVFLIALIPKAFSYLYDFQDDLVSNQLVEKIVLGMDTSDNSKPGQILAAYTFASFCAPNDNVSAEALDSSGADLYNKAVTEDIDNIKDMDGVINSKTDGKYDLEYNPIIAPAVGLYVLYQLIILCMDVALRTIKLGLLELITPIILCGYVIVGTEILQKWAKMVFTTFVLLFLKIALVSFMVYGLSLLPDFLSNFSDKGFFYRGFLRVFMIIGLLQLIKQAPDIINNIFGSNIKSRGGIRGRLGEMAAVGELAQKGWDKLRTGIGPKAALVAGVLASGPAGIAAAAAVGAGAGVLHHGWKRGFGKDGTPWRETSAGRGLRKFGAGAKAVGTGLTTKGGIIAGTKAGIKSYQDSGITKDVGFLRNIKSRISTDLGIGMDDRVEDVTSLSTKKKKERTEAALAAERNIENVRGKALAHGKLAGAADRVAATQHASRNKIIGEAAQKKFDSLKSQLETMIANTTVEEERSFISDLLGGLNTGRMSVESIANSLGDKYGSGDANYKRFKSDGEKFERLARNVLVDDQGNSMKNSDGTDMTVGDYFGRTDSGGFVITNVNDNYKRLDATYTNNKGKLDALMDDRSFNDEQKTTVEALLTNSDIIYKEIAGTTSTFNGGNAANAVDAEGNAIAASFGDGLVTPVASVVQAAPAPAAQNSNLSQAIVQDSGESTQQVIDRVNNVHDAPTRDEHNERYQDLASVFGSDFSNNNQTSSTSSPSSVPTGGATTASTTNEPVTANVDLSGLNESLNNINKSIDNATSNITSSMKDQTTTLSNNMTTERKLQGKEFNKTISNLADSINKKDEE